MKITKFKFTKENYNNEFLPILIKRINIFGLIYLIQYLSYAITHVMVNKSTDPIIQNEFTIGLQTLIDLEFHPYLKFIKTENIIESLILCISFLSLHFFKPNQDLFNFFSFLEQDSFISKINVKVSFWEYPIINKTIPITSYLLNSFDIQNKIIPYLSYKLKNQYILVKDKSHWGGLNWYSLEYHTRGNTFFKFVIPFYRSIKKHVVTYQILLYLGFLVDDEFTNIYMPPKYDSYLKSFGDTLLKELSTNFNFLIGTNYKIINNTYYVYNKKLIDLDFTLFQLNTKYFERSLKIKPIIRKCLKKL